MISFNWFERIPPYRLTALRVLLACALAVSIADLLGVDRSYWAILAIISITVSINIGDMISRSRVLASLSLLGCIVGTFLFYWLSQILTPTQMIMVVMVVAIIYLYAVQIHYPTGIFLNCIFLVMFIGILSSWSIDLLWTRVIDVLIGVFSMLIVSYIIRGRHHKNLSMDKVKALINDHQILVEQPEEITLKQIESLEVKQAEMIKTLYQLRYDFPSKKDYYKMREVVLSLEDLLLSYHGYIGLCNYRDQHQAIYEEMLSFCRQKMARQFERVSNKLQNIIQ